MSDIKYIIGTNNYCHKTNNYCHKTDKDCHKTDKDCHSIELCPACLKPYIRNLEDTDLIEWGGMKIGSNEICSRCKSLGILGVQSHDKIKMSIHPS